MDPGNPTDPSGTPGTGPEPDPGQPGWASPSPPQPPVSQPPPPSPPAPPGAPTMPAAGGTPPPVRKRRLTWLWILIPVLFVFLVSVVLVIVFAVRLVVGPIDATNDYFALLRDGRYAAAYAERCDSFQAEVSLDEFVTRERAAGPVRDFDIDEFDTEGDDATTHGTVERSGIRYDVTVRLEQDGGDWKVCTIEANN